MDWNGNSLSKLTELCEELKSHNPIQETMKNAILKLNNDGTIRPCEVMKYNEELEKEKCELLGIIQGKDEVIAELKAQLEKMKNEEDI